MMRRREETSAPRFRRVDERPVTRRSRRAFPTSLAPRLRFQLVGIERPAEKIDAEFGRQRLDERDVAVRLRAARTVIDRRDENIAPQIPIIRYFRQSNEPAKERDAVGASRNGDANATGAPNVERKSGEERRFERLRRRAKTSGRHGGGTTRKGDGARGTGNDEGTTRANREIRPDGESGSTRRRRSGRSGTAFGDQ